MNFEKQIMSKNKYPSIFLHQNGGYCVYHPSNIFHNTCSFENWGILLLDVLVYSIAVYF